MFEFSPEGKSYYLRFHVDRDYLNLLYIPGGAQQDDQINLSLMHLFREYADPKGVMTYYDPRECCLITLRMKDISELRVYLYDDEAPYEGFYLDGRFLEALEDV